MLWEDELPRRRFIRRPKYFGFRLGNYGFWWRRAFVLSLAKWEEALQHQKEKLNRVVCQPGSSRGRRRFCLSGRAFLLHVTRPSASLAASGRGNTRKSRGGRLGQSGGLAAWGWSKWEAAEEIMPPWIAVISAAVAIAGGAAVTSAGVCEIGVHACGFVAATGCVAPEV